MALMLSRGVSRPISPQAGTSWTLMETRLQTPSAAIQVLKTKMTYIDRGSCRRIG